ncbi:hypothetical protein LQR31_10485 [Chromobacterium vaccinii]|uniref:hypothetical protein n=1 Tax=Chromobacterium vaccinii TaxID=1108595 RepID=UPI001E28BA8B|nr:hypothetical protein [Chromobacterium vaccinii]MCD4484900.1 hypothetical protein [Chromobacterium vaccinii]
MLKKLKLDALKADLSQIDSLLEERTEEIDPIGHFQYASRREDILSEIEKLGQQPETHAEMGIYFGGSPVQGSRGINADFAGKAIDNLQAIVSKRFSSKELGKLATRGRVPMADSSQLLITNTIRGSFGFVLEEAGDNSEIVDTPLKEVVDEISDLLSRVGAIDENFFEEAISSLDERILVTLKQFFQHLDENGATIRIVQGNRDFILDHQAVSLARARTQELEISETDDEYRGTLYLLPNSRRFELCTETGGAPLVLSGTVSQAVIRQLAGQPDLGEDPIDPRDISQALWRVTLHTRQIKERHRAPRQLYTLTKLIQRINQ